MIVDLASVQQPTAPWERSQYALNRLLLNKAVGALLACYNSMLDHFSISIASIAHQTLVFQFASSFHIPMSEHMVVDA